MPFAKTLAEEELGPVCGFSFLIGPIRLFRFSHFGVGGSLQQELIRLSGIQERATAVVASREEDGCASLMLIKKYPRLGRRRRRRGGGVK